MSSKSITVLLAAVMLFVLGSAVSSRAQRRESFDTSLPKLLEKEKQFELPQKTVTRPQELIPLDGKLDRNEYRLGPGDEVDVTIWGTDPLLTYNLVVSGEGRLLVPPAGALEVAELTLVEAESYLAQELAKYFSKDAPVTLTLMNPRTFRAYVAGAILLPGTYAVSSMDRASDLIRAAGGIKRGGSKRRVRLLTKDNVLVREVDMMRHEATGSLADNPRLDDGCVVEVPPIDKFVVLMGRFANLSGTDTIRVKDWNLEEANEFIVEFKPGESLKDLLTLAGAPLEPDSTMAGKAFFSRSGLRTNEYFPLTPEMLSQPLQSGTYYDFPIRNNWVFVTGSTNAYGRYIYKPGWNVQDYLGQAGGPNWNGSQKTIYLRRLDGQEFKCKPSEPVFPGDVIYIPEKFHMDRIYPVLAGLASAIIIVLFNN